MDDFDRAQALNEDFQAYALQQQLMGHGQINYTGDLCIDCEDPIPVKRKQAMPGCCRCIDCQELFEMKGAL